MRPYAVEISFTMIVMAENENDAEEAAEDNANDAWRETAREVFVLGPVKSEEELGRHGWNVECIPYGGDGDTRLKDILANLEPEPVRDTQTVDMFAEG